MSRRRDLRVLGLVVALSGVLVAGCGEDTRGDTGDTGGPITNTNGGATAGTNGGATAGTNGGATAGTNGGTTAGTNGGTTGSASAGTSGGSSAGTSGGSSAGTSGGTNAGTSGGTTAGTSSGTTGGSDDDAGTAPPGTSPGCGKASPPASGMYNIDVAGTSRMFIIKLPTGYDANKPYKLVFAWHYLGGNAAGIARGYYGLDAMSAGTAIFVAPEGINAGWSNTGGQDVAFAKAMVEKFKTDYCIDTERIFSVGFSYGAIMSNTVGSQMGDVFRAIAPMAGMGVSRGTGPVAVWIYHGGKDTTLNISGGEAARDFWVKNNGCTTPGPADANGCVTYQGCMQGYPVVWCYDANAGHTQPRYGSTEIWKFFSQF